MRPKKESYRSGEKSLTPAQVEKLLEQVTDLQDLVLLELALTTGIRREDIVRIRTKDVNFERETVTFLEQKKNRTKTIPLMRRAVQSLSMWLKINKSPYLFPARQISGNRHMNGKTAYNIFNKYLKKAGLEPRPFHALRATTVKLCQKAGWSEQETAELIGDKISTIQKHYATPTPEELKERAQTRPIL